MKTPKALGVSVLVFVAAMGSLVASPIGVSLGTGGPPGQLGGFDMTAFGPDPAAIGSSVLALTPPATSPVTGSLVFDTALTHYSVGDNSWASWSHGYTGDVYWYDVFGNGGSSDSLVLWLPAGTRAFDFYVEPSSFFSPLTFELTAMDTAGTTFTMAQNINGQGGAMGFGFYSDAVGESLTKITVTGFDTWPDGFAVGEFGINHQAGQNVPESGTTAAWLAGALVCLGAAWRRMSS